MTLPAAVQPTLPGYVELPPMTRAEYDELPEDVRYFLPWDVASRPAIVPMPGANALQLSDEETEELLRFFELVISPDSPGSWPASRHVEAGPQPAAEMQDCGPVLSSPSFEMTPGASGPDVVARPSTTARVAVPGRAYATRPGAAPHEQPRD